MQLSTFLCRLHGFPMVAFGFTTPVYLAAKKNVSKNNPYLVHYIRKSPIWCRKGHIRTLFPVSLLLIGNWAKQNMYGPMSCLNVCQMSKFQLSLDYILMFLQVAGCHIHFVTWRLKGVKVNSRFFCSFCSISQERFRLEVWTTNAPRWDATFTFYTLFWYHASFDFEKLINSVILHSF